ncbi:copper chaperone PCu(A)C [Primorskyibacter aestuariivivens]|uniref:copper chaperone PCu(A)C n=1 Tax=Primorskyibacter aestuariivivens TaxID=1888912 RepID=UPI002300252C|nr:copper chaperone PCu(A)C [Primorskyibacter aestuariivivens]MDA7427443.1 copper chaperone PCu(A)C [Primorskyibacter aestuariivivens]
MLVKRIAAASVAALFATAGFAADITIKDPYARASTMMSKSGAIFMTIVNAGDSDDRVIAASVDVAEKAELHTHKEDANGVMRMMELEEGFAVPAGGMHMLKRGGDHVMMLGLTRALEQGDMITLTLTLENAGEITVDVPVDLNRKPMHGNGHGQMNQGSN